MAEQDVPALECALRCAAQSPPGYRGGRHLERGAKEALKTRRDQSPQALVVHEDSRINVEPQRLLSVESPNR